MFGESKVLMLRITFIVSLTLLFGADARLQKTPHLQDEITNTGLLSETNEETLLVSTLDGALHAITKSSGALKWTLRDDPVIVNPTDSTQPPFPQFFPNPQDGSLYRYTLGRSRDPLKKLPFTIPQLVANSPCRSSDGIFYLGKKVDSWVGVDSITGEKQLTLDMSSVDKKCPKPSRNTVYFGRTLYNIVLYEATTGNKWNISFSEYATGTTSAVENYDLVHYTSTGEGSVLTIDQTGSLQGSFALDSRIGSPLVAMYQLSPNGGLLSVPTTTVASQTLHHFTEEFMQLSHHNKDDSDSLLVKKLSPTIYIGECSSGVYAVPTLVDETTVTISRKGSRLLLGGPPGSQGTIARTSMTPKDHEEKNPEVLLLGYYEIPENGKVDLAKATPEELVGLGDRILPLGITHEKNDTRSSKPNRRGVPTLEEETVNVIWDGFDEMKRLNISFVTSGSVIRWWGAILHVLWLWLTADVLNILVIVLIIGMGAIGVLLYRQARDYARLTREMSSGRMWSQGSASSGSSRGNVTATAEELDNGNIRVGKIVFDPQQLLGKGCDGTFVFQGTFDGRCVAVKRVLPGCFSIADREVDLLRESDQHANVIRYFCTEQCRQFRYIALELCSATLEDFIQGHFKADIGPHTLLYQASSGLQHLHNLDIVHRDIKPHNVLLSTPNSRGEVRAMISDFGLCKRLETGRMSFSKRSGITGTEGWIAPEMMLNTSRPTCKVDIFSLGCVYYYVLTRGKHPFGSVLDRQSNIISGRYILQELEDDHHIVSKTLIEKMLSSKPSERPPISAILKHPFYWTRERELCFFQDVSDRVEKEGCNSFVVTCLERCGIDVVRGDWRLHMHPIIAEDLRRFRDYKGNSVRDLLRALRNKRNHYRELKEEARMVFGRIPDEFIYYWTSRFPRLLLHTWCAMLCVKSEPIFSKYYDSQYSFSQDYLQENHSFAPNNPYWSESSVNALSKGKQKAGISQRNILDSLLWGGLKKTEGSAEKESKGPVWIIEKPRNTFEPCYRLNDIRSRADMDKSWRKTDKELDKESQEVMQNAVMENVPHPTNTEVKEENLNAMEIATLVPEDNREDPEEDKEEKLGCTEFKGKGGDAEIVHGTRTSDVRKQEHFLQGIETINDEPLTEISETGEQVINRRGYSQVRFRSVESPKKMPETEKHIKIVTGSGKKKKSKKLSLALQEGNE
ncbi:serine/threonine-protein kinase/endoribonuclease IRE1-like isoform X2 [Macrobrachium nipponense]|uniref:serine/threonine-protein kinase/endoribonuclease IRE1-like isoform X2 n=1 Tax=Macrobrachium nipponense TaxID=159736 RepID=UPI0030C7FDB6